MSLQCVLPLKSVDRTDRLFICGFHRLQQVFIRFRSAQGFRERRAYGVQAGKAEVLGNALQRVGGEKGATSNKFSILPLFLIIKSELFLKNSSLS